MLRLLWKKIAMNKKERVKVASGGTTIFGVDGSPVVHDVYMRVTHPTAHGKRKMASVLYHTEEEVLVSDECHPIVEDSEGPIHMFSIFNDQINKKILQQIMRVVLEEPYNSGLPLLRQKKVYKL